MRFIINSQLLLENLQSISSLLTENKALPILEKCLFKIEGNKLTLVASDSESVAVVDIFLEEVNGEGSIAVPARQLMDTLKTIANMPMVFDIDLALSQSDENPVYYLQYAHARICSVFAQAKEKGFSIPTQEAIAEMDLSALSDKNAQALIARISEFPETLSVAAKECAPHTLCFYLKDLAGDFHAFYNAERVLVEDEAVRNARLALLLAARQVLRNGLDLLGVSAPEKM